MALGWIILHLNKDCLSPTGQVGSKPKIKINLDVNGQLDGAPLFWPNSELMPNDSVYILSVYTSVGQRVLGPVEITVGPSSVLFGFGTEFGGSFGS